VQSANAPAVIVLHNSVSLYALPHVPERSAGAKAACKMLVILTQDYSTVKPVYNDHPWDPKFVAIVDSWALFRGSFMLQILILGPQNSSRCSRYSEVVVNSGLTAYPIVFTHFARIFPNSFLSIFISLLE